MLWTKAFHLIFVASWFAAMFYAPRILVNLAQVPLESTAERDRLINMAQRLHRFGTGLMVVALTLGLVLWLGYGAGRGQGWLHAKLVLVGLAVVYHFTTRHLLESFRGSRPARSVLWYRVYNEIGVLLFAAIVILAVVRPW